VSLNNLSIITITKLRHKILRNGRVVTSLVILCG